ncbi:hypothetical protein JOB18_028343 [Solea senegalensis]|uniref:Uncharacterized protein n=1 Tax=Solea senegalensis TaxID=28829 RepID=A0AAV6PVF8_SOLSE|nr:hypothetical protein JOB18_028343 [Solea senegalensis]
MVLSAGRCEMIHWWHSSHFSRLRGNAQVVSDRGSDTTTHTEADHSRIQNSTVVSVRTGEDVRTVRLQEPGAEAGMREKGFQPAWV